jgi:hypothetical protein
VFFLFLTAISPNLRRIQLAVPIFLFAGSFQAGDPMFLPKPTTLLNTTSSKDCFQPFRWGISPPVAPVIPRNGKSLPSDADTPLPGKLHCVDHQRVPATIPTSAASLNSVNKAPAVGVNMFQTIGPFTGNYSLSQEPAIQGLTTHGPSRKPPRAEPFRHQDAQVTPEYKPNWYNSAENRIGGATFPMTLTGLVPLFDNPQLLDWVKHTNLLLNKPADTNEYFLFHCRQIT